MAMYKIGDVVSLLSGGPEMTVVDPENEVFGNIQVQVKFWNESAQKFVDENFPELSLVTVRERGK